MNRCSEWKKLYETKKNSGLAKDPSDAHTSSHSLLYFETKTRHCFVFSWLIWLQPEDIRSRMYALFDRFRGPCVQFHIDAVQTHLKHLNFDYSVSKTGITECRNYIVGYKKKIPRRAADLKLVPEVHLYTNMNKTGFLCNLMKTSADYFKV